MNKNNLDFDEIQDGHLDALLRLAYRQMNAMETQEVIHEVGDEPGEMSQSAIDAYARYAEKLSKLEREDRRRTRQARWKKRFPRVVEVAACFIIVLGISASIAIANVESIRVRVLEMLISFQDGHVEVDLIENETASFDIPSNWPGLYYPSYIPADYQIKWKSKFVPSIEFENEEMMKISFDECDEGDATSVDSEGAVISLADVNGAKATVLDATGLGKMCSVIWSVNNRYFIVSSSLSADQALEVARSVRRIQE